MDGRLAGVTARTAAYAEAGADGVFVPRLLDLGVLREPARGLLPVNVMAGPGGPAVVGPAEAGVRRIGVGTGVAHAACTAARDVAVELLGEGSCGALDGSPDFSALNGLFGK
ncbi:hypothetical protein GCM10010446_02700 [Streptomyces enissocaesilis]|uniref:Uncharacterized protein n=1 Tax=Streptomyces enissocaesilis TaxID=332589 RepID=A0ABN3WMS6_9ACTN